MVHCRHSGICCFGVKSRVALDRDKNGMLLACTLRHARAWTGRRRAQMPTKESRSMNGRGQAEEQVLRWWQIWLLSTSAFLNTRTYLPSPLEERSFLFSFLPLPSHPLSCSLVPAQPSLRTHLSGSHLSLSTSLAHFPVFFFFLEVSGVLFSLSLHSSPPPLYPLLLLSLSMEQPIQQQNKAASSITRWLIKQDQNSAASTLQHQATRRRRGGGVEERTLRRMNIQTAMMPIKDNAGDNH